MDKHVIDLIEERRSKLSKGQKRIADYIIAHYDKAAFMTASKLGISVGVSESTVVRFAIELGYDGYPQLQKGLKELIRNRLTSVQRIEVLSDQIKSENVLEKTLDFDIDKIRRTHDETSHETFDASVDALLRAKHIYIMGVRSSFYLAGFLNFYFHYLFDNVKLLNTSSVSEMYEQLLRIGEGDVFIAISFPRYSKSTVRAVKYAKDRGATIVSITDSHTSPIAQNADHLVMARSDMISFVDSLVAPLSVINALIVAVGLKKQVEVSKTFQDLEHIWEEYHVYEKAEKSSDGDV